MVGLHYSSVPYSSSFWLSSPLHTLTFPCLSPTICLYNSITLEFCSFICSLMLSCAFFSSTKNHLMSSCLKPQFCVLQNMLNSNYIDSLIFFWLPPTNICSNELWCYSFVCLFLCFLLFLMNWMVFSCLKLSLHMHYELLNNYPIHVPYPYLPLIITNHPSSAVLDCSFAHSYARFVSFLPLQQPWTDW